MKIKRILISVFLVAIFIIANSKVLAETFLINVYFDGKTIRMESETQEIGMDCLNLLPGETNSSEIRIKNKGKEKVEFCINAELVNDEDLLEILSIKMKNYLGEELYSGDFSDFEEIKISLEANETESYIIEVGMPLTAGNKYQDKEANIKFVFTTIGETVEEAIEKEEPKSDEEEEVKGVKSEEIPIETPKTGDRIVFVIAILIVAIIGVGVTFMNKSNKKINQKEKK